MKPILCSATVVRNFLNSEIGAWPANAIDSSKPFQWQDRRPLKNQPMSVQYDGPFIWLESPVSRHKSSHLVWKPSAARVGDVLYVRESFCSTGTDIYFAADEIAGLKWRPSIHMPRELSRIHLEVMRVRVERACDISEDDCIAEGTPPEKDWPCEYPFRHLWIKLYGADAWEKWVWVYDLKRIR